MHEIGDRIGKFYSKWMETVEPPLFVALALLHGTALYEAVGQVNDGINKMRTEGFPAIHRAVTSGHRPDIEPLKAMWTDVAGRRDEQLRLSRQHFSLTRDDIEKSLRPRRP